MTQSMSDRGDCRTAPATPGLLIIMIFLIKFLKHIYSLKNLNKHYNFSSLKKTWLGAFILTILLTLLTQKNTKLYSLFFLVPKKGFKSEHSY